MSKIALSGNASGTGTLTIASPNTNTDRTINLPDSNGTILTTATPGVPVNGPAFSAFKTNGATQAISAATFTKVTLGSESFDTASCFDTSNSRFTPTVAGYYQVSGYINLNTARTTCIVSIFKNGARNYPECSIGSLSANSTLVASGIVYMNGSTDYLEMYAYSDSGTNTIRDEASNTAFSGALVRSAT
jgi:hypothetical protein